MDIDGQTTASGCYVCIADLVLITDTNTGLDITDAGLKDFSAALASSSTITTVILRCKYECLLCVGECMRVFVYLFHVDEEWMLTVGREIKFLVFMHLLIDDT